MLINLQEIKDFVSISAVADYLGLEEEYGKRKFPGERTASIELYPNTQTFYDFGRAVGGDIFDLLSHIKGIGFKEALDEIVDFFKIEVSTSENEETSRPRWINYLEEKKKCRYIEHYNYSLISLKGEYLMSLHNNLTYMVVYHGKMRIIAEHGAVMMIQPYFH